MTLYVHEGIFSLIIGLTIFMIHIMENVLDDAAADKRTVPE